MKLFRPYLIALIVFFLGVVNTKSVNACVCAEQNTPESEFSKTTAVFRGTVTDINLPIELSINGNNKTLATFDVTDAWKGTVSRNQTVETPPSSTNCGYTFKRDEEYIVYATKTEDSNSLVVYLCGRTKPVKDAQADLEFLATIEKQVITNAQKTGFDIANPFFVIIGVAFIVTVITYTKTEIKRRQAQKATSKEEPTNNNTTK